MPSYDDNVSDEELNNLNQTESEIQDALSNIGEISGINRFFAFPVVFWFFPHSRRPYFFFIISTLCPDVSFSSVNANERSARVIFESVVSCGSRPSADVVPRWKTCRTVSSAVAIFSHFQIVEKITGLWFK